METTTEPADNQQARYEKKDFNARLIVTALISLAVGLVLSLLAVWWFLGLYKTLREPGPPVSPLAESQPLPPLPRLQVSPEIDLSALRAREDSVLYTYGWMDRKNGIVRIPIERAMDLLVKKGLPSRPPTPGLNPWAVPGSEGFVGTENTPLPGVPTVAGESQTGPITGKGTQVVGPQSTLQNVGAGGKAQKERKR